MVDGFFWTRVTSKYLGFLYEDIAFEDLPAPMRERAQSVDAVPEAPPIKLAAPECQREHKECVPRKGPLLGGPSPFLLLISVRRSPHSGATSSGCRSKPRAHAAIHSHPSSRNSRHSNRRRSRLR